MDIAIGILITASIPVILAVIADRTGARPSRWLARSRMFLVAISSAIERGVPVEQALIDLSEKRDTEMGVEFHALAAWLNTGLPLHEALEKVPRFLPRSIQVLLVYGSRTGKLKELLPVGQKVMTSLTIHGGQTSRNLFHPLAIMLTLIGITGLLTTFVVPKFAAIFADMGVDMEAESLSYFMFVWSNFDLWLACHFTALGIMIACCLFFAGGPAVVNWMQTKLPRLTDSIHRLFPWQRLEQQRRFGLMLSHLLDAGIPEEPALVMSGEFAGNQWFKRGVEQASKALRNGESLIAALKLIDADQDFQFRMETARRSGSPFREALADWAEAIRARAQFREAAAVDLAHTGFLCYNAAWIGFVGISFFAAEIQLIDAIVVW